MNTIAINRKNININRKSIDLTSLKNNLSEMIDRASHEAVSVMRYGKSVAVIISPADFERYEKLEDMYWLDIVSRRRQSADNKKYLSNKESLKFIENLLVK